MASAAYIVLSELRDELLLPDTTQDTRLLRAITDASRSIDAFCKQEPGAFAAQTLTKYFDVFGQSVTALSHSAQTFVITDNTRVFTPTLTVPPLLSVTSLLTDENADGTFETTWTANTDYYLYPLNAEVKRQIIVNPDQGRYGFPAGRRRVQVAGSWGITEDGETPFAIHRACLLQAERYYKRSNDLTGNPLATSSPSKMVLPLDLDIKSILIDWAGKYRMQWMAV